MRSAQAGFNCHLEQEKKLGPPDFFGGPFLF
jgi:hypothetical protein